MAKKRKRWGKTPPRGSSKAGRPRKEGDRYPGGKLKPEAVQPNERVVAHRRALMGDSKINIASASDPLDFALAKGFLSMARYRAAIAFAELYERTRMGGPSLGRGGPEETPTTTGADDRAVDWRSKNPWDRLTREEITEVFDAVFNVAASAEPDASAARAMTRWKDVQAPLTPPERDEAFSVCVLRSWPQWVILMAAEQPVDEVWDRKRRLLESALDKIGEALKSKRKAAA